MPTRDVGFIKTRGLLRTESETKYTHVIHELSVHVSKAKVKHNEFKIWAVMDLGLGN